MYYTPFSRGYTVFNILYTRLVPDAVIMNTETNCIYAVCIGNSGAITKLSIRARIITAIIATNASLIFLLSFVLIMNYCLRLLTVFAPDNFGISDWSGSASTRSKPVALS